MSGKLKTIHFSVDDVIKTLRWLYVHRPDSIFEMDFFNMLYKWHRDYGLNVSCYVFGSDGGGFRLDSLPVRYIDELIQNQDWIKFGYHGVYGSTYGRIHEEVFNEEYDCFRMVFHEKYMAPSVRLHCWQTGGNSSKTIRKMKQKGINTLLCPENERPDIYDLNAEECNRLKNEGRVIKHGLTYLRTDALIDSVENIREIEPLLNKERLIIYCHEWELLKKAVLLKQIFESNQYEYIF